MTPTIVLVHGGWGDATGFDSQIRALRSEGYGVIGFANPLRDLRSDGAYLAALLQTLEGPIVLVGHSYGGAVISEAATGNDQVTALVYLNGWMPDEGESIQKLIESEISRAVSFRRQSGRFRSRTLTGATAQTSISIRACSPRHLPATSTPRRQA